MDDYWRSPGSDGVDKRIDVLATAIRAGLRVPDLIDLDLAYSPPYGQAKTPSTWWYGRCQSARWHASAVVCPRPYEVAETALILDVRSPAEFSTGHLPGALNIAHTQLRERLDEVRAAAAGRPVRVLCASGVRSAIAHRILAQSGFDSASLSGGMSSLRSVLGDAASDVLVGGGAGHE